MTYSKISRNVKSLTDISCDQFFFTNISSISCDKHLLTDILSILGEFTEWMLRNLNDKSNISLGWGLVLNDLTHWPLVIWKK